MGIRLNRVITFFLIVLLAGFVLSGCNRSATKAENTPSSAQPKVSETPEQSMVTPTPDTSTQEMPTVEADPTLDLTETATEQEAVETVEPTQDGEETASGDAETPEEPIRTEESTYVVAQGDTLFSIALAFGVSIEELAVRNDIYDVHQLDIGQELIIPVPGEVEAGDVEVSGEEQIHIVQSGENLFRIALRYNLPFESVAAYNDIPWPYQIYPGEEIKIPPSP